MPGTMLNASHVISDSLHNHLVRKLRLREVTQGYLAEKW